MKKNNYLHSFLVQLLILDYDFSNVEDIKLLITHFLYEKKLVDIENLLELDFKVESDDDGNYFRVVSNNMVTALWFSGIFPKNIVEVNKKNFYFYKNKKYVFNPQKKTLTIEKQK